GGVVPGGPADRALPATVCGSPRPAVDDLGGRTDFAQLADVLAAADVVVVGNTPPPHLPPPVGPPFVSPFPPPVPPVRWRPWRVPHQLLGDQTAPCANSRARECPVPGHPCLRSVEVGDVLDAVEGLTA